MGVEMVAAWLDVILLVFAIAGAIIGAGKSLYNGVLKEAIEAIRRVEDLVQTQERLCEEQNDLNDAVYVLAAARAYDNYEIDGEQIIEDLDDNGIERYIDRDSDRGPRPGDD